MQAQAILDMQLRRLFPHRAEYGDHAAHRLSEDPLAHPEIAASSKKIFCGCTTSSGTRRTTIFDASGPTEEDLITQDNVLISYSVNTHQTSRRHVRAQGRRSRQSARRCAGDR